MMYNKKNRIHTAHIIVVIVKPKSVLLIFYALNNNTQLLK